MRVLRYRCSCGRTAILATAMVVQSVGDDEHGDAIECDECDGAGGWKCCPHAADERHG